MDLPLDKMSVEDKLRTMELIWEDLLRTPTDIPSPLWHRDVLEAREKRIREGRDQFIPWDEAKRDFRTTES